MGFKTLAIQKRSGEVWQLLGAVKTEFDKFGQGLSKMQQRLRQTDEELDNLKMCIRDRYYGVEEEHFFLIQWYPDEAAAKAKLGQLEELGDGKQYLVDFALKRENPSSAENFGNSNPVQLRS